MTTASAESSPPSVAAGPAAPTPSVATPVPTARPLGRIETDAFCVCGYNLHSLPVTLDERLSLPLCRCPECGRFHAAGAHTSATAVWLTRLGSFLTLAWFLFLVALFLSAVFGLFVQQIVHFDLLEHARRAPGRYYDAMEYQPWVPLSLAGGVLAGFLFPLLLTSFLWHLRRFHYALSLAVPFVLTTVILVLLVYSDGSGFVGVEWTDYLLFPTLQSVGCAVGIFLGRRIVRASLRLFLPPRPLQFLAFLWHADGLAPPSVNGAPGKSSLSL